MILKEEDYEYVKRVSELLENGGQIDDNLEKQTKEITRGPKVLRPARTGKVTRAQAEKAVKKVIMARKENNNGEL